MNNNLTFSITSADHKNRTFYFIWDNQRCIPETRGTDLATCCYLLLFKVLRHDDENYDAYLKMLAEQSFLSDPDKQKVLIQTLKQDEGRAYREQEQSFDLNQINPEDRRTTQEYVAQFNPHQAYEYAFRSEASSLELFVKMAERDRLFDQMMSRILEMLFASLDSPRDLNVSDFFTPEELKVMIQGGNGDLWVEFFQKLDFPGIDKFELLYQAQGLAILNKKMHLKKKQYVLAAIESLKFESEKLEKLQAALPASMLRDQQILDLFSWHN